MKKLFVFIIILALISTGGFWYYSKINAQNQDSLRRRLERQNAILANQTSQVQQEKPFDKKYTVIYSEPSAQHIYVPLGLSSNDLKANLEHAAKSSQKDYIFAYRIDDAKHDGGYTAGRYHAGKFDIAEVYTKSKKVYPSASEAIINKDNVNLYSRPDFDPSDVLVKLKKDTQIMIIEHAREFTMTDIIDLYKIIAQPKKHIGWVMDSDIELNSHKTENPQITVPKVSLKTPKTINVPPKVRKEEKTEPDYFAYIDRQEKNEIYRLISSYNSKKINGTLPLTYWKNSYKEAKIATCGHYIGFALSNDILSKAILSARDLISMAEHIANWVDTAIYGYGDTQLGKITIGETIFRVMDKLDLLKYPLIK